MKILRSKSTVSTVALVLMLTVAATVITGLPVAFAQKITTAAYLSFRPNPIGIDQILLVNMWVVPYSVMGYDNYTVVITDPDGITETITLDSYGDGSAYFLYVPDKLGTWKLKFTWAGDATHEGCESPEFTLTVQQEQIPSWPPAELPTDYWERPINAENREWYTIAGDWPFDHYNASASCENQYSLAPNSAHILWKSVTGFGGIIGGEYGSLSGGSGRSVSTILQGRGYYNAPDGIHCIDIRTGEELWVMPGSFNYAISGSSPTLLDIGSTFTKYDAFTGLQTFTMTGTQGGGPGRPMAFDGTYVYSQAGSPNNLTKWTTAGTSTDFSSRIQWTVTVHSGTGLNVWGDVVVIRGTNYTSVNANTGEIIASQPPVGRLIAQSGAFYGKTIVPCNDMKYYAYDLDTMSNVWISDPADYPWGSFWAYQTASGYGNIYGASYAGLYCFNATTGKIEWAFHSGDAGMETPYGAWAFWLGPIVADGKVYAGTSEHSPSQPRIRGNRLYCIDAIEGNELWSISGAIQPTAIADGILLGTNENDATMYAFGKGLTATTVSAPQTTIAKGSSVLIQGTVLDQSPAQPGTPCVSEESMSAWMEYLHMQKPEPGIGATTGVPVDLRAIGSDGSVIDIGRVTSDSKGCFMCEWTPPDEDLYMITATFNGDESYYGSWAETGLSVGAAPPEPTEPAVQEDIDDAVDSLNDSFTPMFLGLIVAVAVAIVIGIVNLWALRKRP